MPEVWSQTTGTQDWSGIQNRTHIVTIEGVPKLLNGTSFNDLE